MKHLLKSIWILLVVMLAFTACNENEMSGIYDLEGTYVGQIKTSQNPNGPFVTATGNGSATASVSIVGDDKIQVHCYGELMDTTLILDHYLHNDSVMVCSTGDDFEHIYGHRLGEGHMAGSGGMMGDRKEHETEWMHHLSDEHQDGDEHFGGFNSHDNSFHYTFQIMNEGTFHYLRFEGMKER